jgi:hypothetical protein
MADRPCAVVQARPVALRRISFGRCYRGAGAVLGHYGAGLRGLPPRSPEQGVLHTVVRTHLDAFLQEVARAL